jgi:hypothetical protein
MVNEIKLKYYMVEMVKDYFQDYCINYGFYYRDGEIKVLKQPKKKKDNGALILTMPQGKQLEPRRVCSFSEIAGFNCIYKDDIYTFEKLIDSIESYIVNHINDKGLLSLEEVISFKNSLKKAIEAIENEGLELKLQTNYYRSPGTALMPFMQFLNFFV